MAAVDYDYFKLGEFNTGGNLLIGTIASQDVNIALYNSLGDIVAEGIDQDFIINNILSFTVLDTDDYWLLITGWGNEFAPNPFQATQLPSVALYFNYFITILYDTAEPIISTEPSSSIPDPATVTLISLGLAGMSQIRRRTSGRMKKG